MVTLARVSTQTQTGTDLEASQTERNLPFQWNWWSTSHSRLLVALYLHAELTSLFSLSENSASSTCKTTHADRQTDNERIYSNTQTIKQSDKKGDNQGRHFCFFRGEIPMTFFYSFSPKILFIHPNLYTNVSISPKWPLWLVFSCHIWTSTAVCHLILIHSKFLSYKFRGKMPPGPQMTSLETMVTKS